MTIWFPIKSLSNSQTLVSHPIWAVDSNLVHFTQFYDVKTIWFHLKIQSIFKILSKSSAAPNLGSRFRPQCPIYLVRAQSKYLGHFELDSSWLSVRHQIYRGEINIWGPKDPKYDSSHSIVYFEPSVTLLP